jgi:hypothetical protein
LNILEESVGGRKEEEEEISVLVGKVASALLTHREAQHGHDHNPRSSL